MGGSSQIKGTLQSYDEKVLIMTRLGLTSVQARVYIALVQSGISTIKTISKASGVARQDIYRIMSVLQKLDIVEKIIAAPTMFKAIPAKDALSILVERKIKETSELQAKTKELLKKLRETKTLTMKQQQETQFILIPKKKALILRYIKAVMAAQRSIDVTITWKRFPQLLLILAKELRKAIKRGVKIRFITEKTEYENSSPEIIQAFTRDPSFKLRFIRNHPNTVFAICDEKEVFITTSTKGYTAEHPALWSNNPCLIAAMHDLFEIMWFTSLETNINLIETTPS
jgi:sugar-specific transcriptional regulator TrmB